MAQVKFAPRPCTLASRIQIMASGSNQRAASISPRALRTRRLARRPKLEDREFTRPPSALTQGASRASCATRVMVEPSSGVVSGTILAKNWAFEDYYQFGLASIVAGIIIALLGAVIFRNIRDRVTRRKETSTENLKRARATK